MGITWNSLNNSGLKIINDIAISEKNKIYLATREGIFIGNIDSISLDTEIQIMSEKSFSLSQNYPNPFNPITTIKYSVGSRQLATIKVYDVLGREVATLVNEEKQPGVYEVEFDGSKLTSGTYFYR